MAAFHTYRLVGASVRGRTIRASSDTFLSVALAADYQLGEVVGAAPRVIEEVSDRSATITLTVGAYSLEHALLSEAYAEQQAAKIAGNPQSAMAGATPNGDAVSGLGVLSRPTTMDGGTASGTRQWTVMIPEARVLWGVGLAAALAAQAGA